MDNSEFLNSDAFGPGGLRRFPDEPCLSEVDQRINDFRNVGFDIPAILAWVNDPYLDIRRSRIQFLTSIPALVPALAMNGNLRNPAFRMIEAVIDRGYALVDNIAGIIGVSKPAVLYLCGKSPALIGKAWLNKVIELLWAIEILPPELRPQSSKDWETFRSYWVLANLSGSRFVCDHRLVTRKRMQINEYVFIGLCRYGYNESALNRLRQIAEGSLVQIQKFRDYLFFVDYWLDHDWLDNEMPDTSLAEGLLMRYSLTELIQQSARWHREIKQHPPQYSWGMPLLNEPFLDSWPGILPEPFMTNDLQVVSLTCSNALEQEARCLENCANIFNDSCLSGFSHILSIRDEHGFPLSTIELDLVPDKRVRWRARVLDTFAYESSEPDQACITALNQVLLHLREPAMQEHLSKIQRFHEDRRDALEAHLAANRKDTKATNTAIMRAVLPDFDAAVAWIDEEYMRYETSLQTSL